MFIKLSMNRLFETSFKFPNNFVLVKPVVLPDQPTNKDVSVLHLNITSHTDIQISLIPLWAEEFGTIDLKFYGVPIEVRQKVKVLLYGIFQGIT